jgi:hypothetical protein
LKPKQIQSDVEGSSDVATSHHAFAEPFYKKKV